MIHADILGERARLTPGAVALVDVASGTRYTYGELDARAQRCASWMRGGLGLGVGDRVGLLAANCVEYVDFIFAAAKSGIILVPLNTRLTSHELGAIARDSGMRALVYEETFATACLELQQDSEIERLIPLRGDASASYASATGALPDGSFKAERLSPEHVLALLYTSGTTGKPKGVMLPHRMVAWNAYNTVVSWQLRDDDVSPVFTPMYHAGGLAVFLTPLFAIGGRIVLHRQFDAGDVWRSIEAERCTVVLGVPTIWKLLMEDPGFERADLSSVRWLISGGAPLPQFIADTYRRRGVIFKQGYGLTEVGVNCFAMTPDDSLRKAGSIGKPLMMTEARVAAGDGSEAEAGAVGELWLRGPHVTSGYWNAPELTAASLDDQGWFHTGDVATRDEEGFYYIAGRQKDMFISGGVNVYPAEIEAHLLQLDALADAAVVGVPHPTWGEMGVAFLVARPGVPRPATEAVLAYLEERLARFKLPRAFRFVPVLPRTASGKVQKAELQRLFSEDPDAGLS